MEDYQALHYYVNDFTTIGQKELGENTEENYIDLLNIDEGSSV